MNVSVNKPDGICKAVLSDNFNCLYVHDPLYGGMYNCHRIYLIDSYILFRFPQFCVIQKDNYHHIEMKFTRNISGKNDTFLYLFRLSE